MICAICGKEVIRYYLYLSTVVGEECWRDYKYESVQRLLNERYYGLAGLLQKELDFLEPHKGDG